MDDNNNTEITKLEYFAAKAMQGYLANPEMTGKSTESIVIRSYNIAELMMEELKKRQE